ncbi:MAG: VWA domain-containing protein [Archangiaceae bacterium]|nr:VWA domain-containing protein [Archangiaceae bacterium]
MNRFLLFSALLAVPAFAATPPEPKVQIAILLDTSSSMDGLINQTKEQLWKIVNTFATAKREGKRARIELALYEYGNDRLSAESGYLRQISPLTQNLDAISEQLFALKTNGGSEYCGQVISKAVEQLEWSRDPHDLKLIYIAGNEPFTQGPVDYKKSVKGAIERGIVVNTIHCGDEQAGISGEWKAAALLADGNFLTIDQNRAVAYVAAPQDKELAELGAKLNSTYVGYGRAAPAAAARQEAQDKNAAGLSMGSMAARAVSKSSGAYDNSEWDLVDAKQKGGKDLAKMEEAELPAQMRGMKPADREAFVTQKAKERTALQTRIQQLNGEREKFVQAEMKKQAAAPAKTMDAALIQSAKAQGSDKAFSFE